MGAAVTAYSMMRILGPFDPIANLRTVVAWQLPNSGPRSANLKSRRAFNTRAQQRPKSVREWQQQGILVFWLGHRPAERELVALEMFGSLPWLRSVPGIYCCKSLFGMANENS